MVLVLSNTSEREVRYMFINRIESVLLIEKKIRSWPLGSYYRQQVMSSSGCLVDYPPKWFNCITRP